MTTEIRDDIELEIEQLRKSKNAVLLAHYYQQADIQDIADHVGDSLSLSRTAAKCDQDVIVFCGVRFMAETAKVLNPTRTVVLPDLEAGCSLVDGCPPAAFKIFREKYPDHVVVTGDLTNIALESEVEAARGWLAKIGSPEVVTAIPGNHDAYVRTEHASTFEHWSDYMAADGAAAGPVELPGHEQAVTAVAISADAKSVFTGGATFSPGDTS